MKKLYFLVLCVLTLLMIPSLNGATPLSSILYNTTTRDVAQTNLNYYGNGGGLTNVNVSLLSNSVKNFGAKGDGITDDTLAINLAMNSITSGDIYFPFGTYIVSHTNIAGTYTNGIFKFRSNIRFIGAEGSIIRNTTLAGGGGIASMFAPDLSYAPITNVSFENLHLENSPYMSGNCGIILCTDQDASSNQIQNITIQNCSFNNFGSAIYILQRTTLGSGTRQVNGVKILNNVTTNCPGSFVTADGEDILISGNTAAGDASGESGYDAVSIHSGIRVTVANNHFQNYHAGGGVINIRNNNNSMCGSRDVIVSGNTIEDCNTLGIVVSLQPLENTYGVRWVNINHNTVKDALTGIYLYSGLSDSSSTPFDNIIVADNIVQTTITGIYIRGGLSKHGDTINVSGNIINMPSTGINGWCLAIENTDLINVTGNNINCKNGNTNQLALYWTNSLSFIFNNNCLTADNAAINSVIVSGVANGTFVGNNIYGAANVYFGDRVIARDNIFRSLSTINDHAIFGGFLVEYCGNLMTVYKDSVPTTEMWNAGDVAINTLATTHTNRGWICISSGPPGTWKAFGPIEP